MSSACLDKWNPISEDVRNAGSHSRKAAQRLNHWLEGDGQLELCLPRPCEVAVVGEDHHDITLEDLLAEDLRDITMEQFLRWNPCLDRHRHVKHGDTVCVGPPGGRYVPEVGTLAAPMKWTVAA